VTKRDLVEKRIRAASTLNIVRIIAQFEEDIIADGALELSREGWREHQGEIRVIVARDYQREGLGMLMMRELYFLALERQVKKMIVKMMRPQVAARSICRKLGFHGEIIVPDYVLDRNGTLQDLIIMSCDIAEMWRDLEHFYSSSDWQRCR
jgi:GNAT superfamily N-acetyltransferase